MKQTYLSLICTCAVSKLISPEANGSTSEMSPDSLFRLDASKTPESPATLSSETAAETDLVLVPELLALDLIPVGGGVSLIGDNGGGS